MSEFRGTVLFRIFVSREVETTKKIFMLSLSTGGKIQVSKLDMIFFLHNLNSVSNCNIRKL